MSKKDCRSFSDLCFLHKPVYLLGSYLDEAEGSVHRCDHRTGTGLIRMNNNMMSVHQSKAVVVVKLSTAFNPVLFIGVISWVGNF